MLVLTFEARQTRSFKQRKKKTCKDKEVREFSTRLKA
jgi:hypothetical protein